eukprot:Nitzschia sp. Nitz4//scaffold339_size21316//14934//16106//NITZ4_008616-RA/size21316-processed-gene-0.17-mRNA-1//1//CDS//3329548357//3052//frame0
MLLHTFFVLLVLHGMVLLIYNVKPTELNIATSMEEAKAMNGDVIVFDRLKKCISCDGAKKQELAQYLPSLIIPGTQKSGTSFISHVLGQHPIAAAYRSETHILNDYKFESAGTVRQCEVWEEYKSVHGQCQLCQNRSFLVDKSVTYLFHSHVVPARLACVFPKPMKLLVLLRNPTERAFSDYQMYVRLKRQGYSGAPGDFFNFIVYEKREIESAGVFPGAGKNEGFVAWKQYFSERTKRILESKSITGLHNSSMPHNRLDHLFSSLVSRGLYALQLTHWIEILSELWGLSREDLVRNYFLILDNDDIKANMELSTARILRFAGLPPQQYDQENFQKSGTIHEYASLTDEERKFLDDYYRPYNVDLHKLLQPYGIEIGFAKRAVEETQDYY